MAIPKVIYQTYSSSKIPLYAKLQIWILRKTHKDYEYHFYDNEKRSAFIKENFPEQIFELYSRIQIGAAKADLFRYALLYINGGIYMDIDCVITKPLNRIIKPGVNTIIAREKTNKQLYLQGVLIYEKKHPILKHTIQIVLNNIYKNKYPYDVHRTTGPTPYSIAVHHYLKNNPQDPFLEIMDVSYNGTFKHKSLLSRIHSLFNRKKHWRYLQQEMTVYRIDK